jgi:predicted phosphodiesterase
MMAGVSDRYARSVLGLLYDVHGNLPALDAVLADAEAAGVERFLLGGDYAAFGAWPFETIERLRELDAEWIRGNVDRWTLDYDDAPEPVRPALAFCRQALGEELARELAGLPTERAEEAPPAPASSPSAHRGGVLYCHASPRSDVESFLPEPLASDADLLAGATAARVVFGHTHLQFRREGPDGVQLVNPGSVGIPLDGDHRPAWAIVHADGAIEPRRVAYDHRASADAIRDRLGADGEVFARRIEQARFEVT